MKRREFIAGLGGAAACSLTSRAQSLRHVGVLMPYPEIDSEGQRRYQAFRDSLTALGWIEGRNLRIDVRWAGPDLVRQQTDARELVALTPDVILVNSTPATVALRNATSTIPIVFVALSDPVATGVVSNLARPGANLTGFMLYEVSLAGKWLSLLRDTAPRLARLAFLYNPNTAPFGPSYVAAAREVGHRFAIEVTAAEVRAVPEIEPAVAAMAGPNNGGLAVLVDTFNSLNRVAMIELAGKYRVPAIYTARFYVEDGGLMSYGIDPRIQFQDGATYVDRILRGAKPAELPVQFATKFELVINLKTAKALGLTVSEALLATANEVIQ